MFQRYENGQTTIFGHQQFCLEKNPETVPFFILTCHFFVLININSKNRYSENELSI